MSLRNVGVRLGLLLALIATACGGQRSSDPPGKTATAVSALVDPSDRTHAGRAAYYKARVAAYRDLAAKEREQAASYLRWSPPAGERATTNWNEKMKAKVEGRAAVADRMAENAQRAADFHVAAAAKGGGR